MEPINTTSGAGDSPIASVPAAEESIFVHLPHEVFAHHMAPLLSPEELCALSGASKFWHDITTSNEVWKQKTQIDYISAFKREQARNPTEFGAWKAFYGKCRNSFSHFEPSHEVPRRHHTIFDMAPWRVRTADPHFPGLDAFITIGGGANVRVWTIDEQGNPQLAAQLRCTSPVSFRKLTVVASDAEATALVILYDNLQTGLLYGMPIQYKVENGQGTLICSSDQIRPIGACPGKRLITRITSHGHVVAVADDSGQLFTFSVDPDRPLESIRPKLVFPGLTLTLFLPMTLQATHHLVEPTLRDGVRIIDIEKSKILTVLRQKNTADPGNTTTAAVSPSGHLVAVGSSTGVIEIFNIKTKEMIATLRLSDASPVHHIVFATNSRLICAAFDGTIRCVKLMQDKHFKHMVQLSIAYSFNPNREPNRLLLLGDMLLVTGQHSSSFLVTKPPN